MSLAVRVIPCLDIADGRVVKGVNFENLRDSGDPVELAENYFQAGADELTFLDVNATVENRATTLNLVTQVAEQVFIPMTVGGGIKSVDDVSRLLAAGADKISLGSAAVANPELISEISERFGNQVVVISLDIKRDSQASSGFVVTAKGGRVNTGLDAVEWVSKVQELGAGELLINSIDADGTKAGFDTEMITLIRGISKVPIIASGGAGNAEDFVPAAEAGADALLAASIFHNGSVSIGDVKSKLKSAGWEVR